jgi:hypothetical protein
VATTQAARPLRPAPELTVRRRSFSGIIRAAQWASGGTRPPRRIRWWFEILLAVFGYWVYALARGLHGHGAYGPHGYRGLADRNGQALFDFEKAVGIDWEKGLQNNVLPYKGLMQAVGGFYGGAHFVVTIGVLVFLLVRRPQFYRFWRTTLFVLTMTAVGIFALFPATPPRLLKEPGGGTLTVDSLDTVGGLWSYNHGVVEKISDGFAPMPSLHLGWATWVSMALIFGLPAATWRRKLPILLYPAVVYFAVIATGTHFVVDGVAGIALTMVMTFVSALVVLWLRRRRGTSTAFTRTGEALPAGLT